MSLIYIRINQCTWTHISNSHRVAHTESGPAEIKIHAACLNICNKGNSIVFLLKLSELVSDPESERHKEVL
jgi:hypothetical protein